MLGQVWASFYQVSEATEASGEDFLRGFLEKRKHVESD